MSTAQQLHRALVDAGLTVRQYPGWETRGRSWAAGKPVGQMAHHTAAPVPFPVDRLAGSLIKCNWNTKPDGTLWLVAYGACNYSSGSGSSKVLHEVRAGTPPTRNARDRGLADDTNGNPYFWNGEHDHAGKGGPLPSVQEETIVVATRVFNDHFELSGRNLISHACWTDRKNDPYWNGNRRAIDDIRDLLTEEAPDMLEIGPNSPPEDIRLVQGLVGVVMKGHWTPETEAAVAKQMGKYTNHPDWKVGKAVGGAQLSGFLKARMWTRNQIVALAGGAGGTGAVIKEIIDRLGGG